MAQSEFIDADAETARGQQDRPLSVSQLTSHVKELLESVFPSVWVVGEISNFRRQQSGHCYFTLKDDDAVLGAVIWRTTASGLSFEPADGMEVVCQGKVDLYPPHGKYQLVVRDIHPKGVGALEQQLRALEKKLRREGLFEAAHKQVLPRFPRRIAAVTSPTGAAVHDFLQVLRRRYNGTDVWVVPVRVQGDGAAREIADAIRLVNRCKTDIDLIVVTRGGGSLEDLWSFNEEAVVRAIFKSRIPVVSAVGHEIDVTLSDLVADVRALTPSEAAELVVPDGSELAAALRGLGQRLLGALRGLATMSRSRLDALASRRVLRAPLEPIRDRQRRLDDLAARALRAIRHRSALARERAGLVSAQLETLSPLSVLGRGYSVTQHADSGQLIHDASVLHPGDEIISRFAQGQVTSRVEEIEG